MPASASRSRAPAREARARRRASVLETPVSTTSRRAAGFSPLRLAGAAAAAAPAAARPPEPPAAAAAAAAAVAAAGGGSRAW
jgi:hypothetical protein